MEKQEAPSSKDIDGFLSKFNGQNSIGAQALLQHFGSGGLQLEDTYQSLKFQKMVELESQFNLSKSQILPIALDIDE